MSICKSKRTALTALLVAAVLVAVIVPAAWADESSDAAKAKASADATAAAGAKAGVHAAAAAGAKAKAATSAEAKAKAEAQAKADAEALAGATAEVRALAEERMKTQSVSAAEAVEQAKAFAQAMSQTAEESYSEADAKALMLTEAKEDSRWGICYDMGVGWDRGWKNCQNGYYITGLQRAGGYHLADLRFKCCQSETHRDQGWGYCHIENVWSSFDRAGWNGCNGNGGTALAGMWVNGGAWLYLLELWRCCKPSWAPNYRQHCYAANWWWTFERNYSWGLCSTNYYLTHVWRNWCHHLGCLEMGHCCSRPHPCPEQLTCRNGGQQARAYGPPCYCQCHSIWYGRDCGLELQRDCYRAWWWGMPRYSPAGSLLGEIYGYFHREAQKHNIPVTCMYSAYAYAMDKFPGVAEIKASIRALAARQHRTDHCVNHSLEHALLAQMKGYPATIASHLGIRPQEVVDQCRTLESRMKLLINIYMMPGEDANMFTTSRWYLSLTQEMPWERLYRLRQGHQNALLRDHSTATEEVGMMNQLLKHTMLRSKRQHQQLSDVERKMSGDLSEINNSKAFVRHTHHMHDELERALKELLKLMSEWKAKVTALGLEASRRFHAEDRRMMKDNHLVMETSEDLLNKATHHVDDFTHHLRLANQSFYSRVKVPIQKAMRAIMRFVISRSNFRREHRRHVRDLMAQMRLENREVKIDTLQNIRAFRSRMMDLSDKATGFALRSTEFRLKNDAAAVNRALHYNIQNMNDKIDRTNANNQKYLQMLHDMMNQENQSVHDIKAAVDAMNQIATNENEKMRKEMRVNDDIITQENAKAQQERREMENSIEAVYRDLNTRAENTMKREEKTTAEDGFKTNAMSSIDGLQYTIEAQVKEMEAINKKVDDVRHNFANLVGYINEGRIKTERALKESHAAEDEMQRKIPDAETLRREEDIEISQQSEVCQKLARSQAIKSAVAGSSNYVNDNMSYVMALASMKSAMDKACAKDTPTHSRRELLALALNEVKKAKDFISSSPTFVKPRQVPQNVTDAAAGKLPKHIPTMPPPQVQPGPRAAAK